jgi:transcriptional regulator with XRE-family HTH domain
MGEGMIYREQSKLLKTARLNAGITQNALAAKLKYTSGQFISNAERQTCRAPRKVLRWLVGEVGKDAVLKAMNNDALASNKELIGRL